MKAGNPRCLLGVSPPQSYGGSRRHHLALSAFQSIDMKKQSFQFTGQLTALALLTAVGCAAQTTTSDANRNNPPRTDHQESSRADRKGTLGAPTLKRGDVRFLKKVAHLGEMEVRLSRVAAERAVSPDVKAFAQEMVRAHSAANQEIHDLAARKGVDLNEERAKMQDDLLKDERKWAEKKADDFDEDYMERMVEDHDDSVDLLTRAAASDDADVAAFSRKLLPDIKAHAMKAEDLEKRVSR